MKRKKTAFPHTPSQTKQKKSNHAKKKKNHPNQKNIKNIIPNKKKTPSQPKKYQKHHPKQKKKTPSQPKKISKKNIPNQKKIQTKIPKAPMFQLNSYRCRSDQRFAWNSRPRSFLTLTPGRQRGAKECGAYSDPIKGENPSKPCKKNHKQGLAYMYPA